MIGRLNRVYGVLNHKQPLTLKVIYRLQEKDFEVETR
jgi:antitoxin component HigA of HigAB toxin-antitoxin module